MKKFTCFALIMLVVGMTLLPGCRNEDPEPGVSDDPPVAGGYSDDRELTDEDWEVFTEAMNLDGVDYAPTLVATQVVAGTNYRFTTTATPVIPDPESYTAYVYIFKPLGGGEAELVDIARTKD